MGYYQTTTNMEGYYTMNNLLAGELDLTKVQAIAKVAHEANRSYCQTIGDFSQVPWDHAPAWQIDSAVNGVIFNVRNPNAPVSATHESWLREKQLTGWKYGPVKNAEAKEHPCCVPYDQLPPEQRKKDALFKGIVAALWG